MATKSARTINRLRGQLIQYGLLIEALLRMHRRKKPWLTKEEAVKWQQISHRVLAATHLWIIAILLCGCQSPNSGVLQDGEGRTMNYEQGLQHYREEQQVHIASYAEWLQANEL